MLRQSAVLLMAVFVSLSSAHAVDALHTDPRGIYLVKVPGTSDPSRPVRTYLGIQLLPDARAFGFVGSVSGNTFTLADVENPSVFADAERESYVHVTSGTGRGFVANVEEFRATDILCEEDLSQWIAPYDRIQIRPHANISDLLGANNKFGLGTGPDAGAADNVVIWDAAVQEEKVYYFNSTRSRWEERGVEADAGHAVFRFPYGFYIVRRSPGTVRIALSGGVGSDPILLPVRTGANVFSLPVNLSASLESWVSGEGGHAVISGPNAKLADILTFEEPTTALYRGPFYRRSQSGASGWREVGVNDTAATIAPLDFLSTLVLRRNGADGYVFVEGSLDPPAIPRPPIPPDPELGETTLKGELVIRQALPPSFSMWVETSTDLQAWEIFTQVIELVPGSPSRVTFDLPAGQGRAFYRLAISVDF